MNQAECAQCNVRRYSEVKRGLEDAELVIHAAILQIPLINETRRLRFKVKMLGTENVSEAGKSEDQRQRL